MPSSDRDAQLFRVIATDEDSGPNADINYSLETGQVNGRFKIHPKTGTIYSKWEFKAGEEYHLTVTSSFVTFMAM